MASTTRSTTSSATDTDKSAGETAREVADSVIGAANEAVARLPEAASTAQVALADAGRTIRSGSDESLSAGTLVSVGFALGLLVGGAPRLLVLLALIPAAAMGLTLLDRQSGTVASKPGTSGSAASR